MQGIRKGAFLDVRLMKECMCEEYPGSHSATGVWYWRKEKILEKQDEISGWEGPQV